LQYDDDGGVIKYRMVQRVQAELKKYGFF
jgi:hypothetical protein